jgi:hypothetical protein
MRPKAKHWFAYRLAGGGRYISKEAAEKLPRDTWVRERRSRETGRKC